MLPYRVLLKTLLPVCAFAIFAPIVASPSAQQSDDAATNKPRTPAFSEPGISPDGKQIAFVSGGDIWTVSSSGGEAHLLISHPAIESRPLFSPDGSQARVRVHSNWKWRCLRPHFRYWRSPQAHL